MRALRTVMALLVVGGMATPLSAQFFIPITLPVTDAATTAKNLLTAAQRKAALDQQREKADLIRRMGRSLDLFAPLIRYRMPGAPLMRTRWPDGLTTRAMQFVDVLNGGDPMGTGYGAITLPIHQVPVDYSTLGHAPATVREAVRQRLGLLQFIDGVTSTSADLNGRVRAARRPYRDALAALETVVTTTADTTKVAAQIAAGTWIKAQQEQVNQQLATEIQRQHIVSSVLERDGATGQMLFSLGAHGTAKAQAPIDSPLHWVIH